MDPLIDSFILDQTPVLVLNVENRIEKWNQGLSQVYGWSQADALGKDAHQLLRTAFPQPLEEIERQLLEQGTWEGELLQMRKDGSPLVVSCRRVLQRSPTGEVLAILEFIHDITEHKQLIDSLPTHICVLDETSTILSTNRAWREFADANPPVPPGHWVGTRYLQVCDAARGPFSEEAAPFAEGLRAVIQGVQDDFILEYPCSAPEGEVRWFNARVTRFNWKGSLRVVVSHTNITERKLIEESLQLQIAAIEAADNAIVIMGRDEAIQWTNRAFTRLTGYTLEEVVGKNLEILRSGAHPEAFYEQLWNTVRAGGVWQGELINRRKDGSLYYEEMSITPVSDSQGKITRFIAIKKDISRRKMAEMALIEEKERFRSLYEDVPVGMYRTTPDGKILMANPALVALLGFETFEELAQRNLEADEYLSDFSREFFKYKIKQDGKIQGLEIGMRRKDGTTVFVRENAHIVLNRAGQVEYYEGTIEDITEIRTTEQQNLRLAAAIENAGETIILTDPFGQIQYANPAFTQLFGTPAADRIGQNILHFSGAYQDPQAWQTILDLPRAGQMWRGDIRSHHANGTYLEIETTISPVMDLNGLISSLVFVMHNVTQERIAEIQRRQSQKLQAIGHLAAGIAHEINTPTQFIGNNIRFLQVGFQDLSRLLAQYQQAVQTAENLAELTLAKEKITALANEIDLDFLKEEIPAAIEGSLNGIDRVTRIVNAMKEFSHPATHEKMVTDINHAIENTLVVSYNEWKYVAEVETDLDPELPSILCLVDEFNQVILNLITNAIDAIRENGFGAADGEKGLISISTRQDGSWIQVKVADNGRGIPADVRDRVFDPFFTTKEVGRGTGQGLSISYDVIVTKHGGKISFESELGKGTTFLIQLPVEPGVDPAG